MRQICIFRLHVLFVLGLESLPQRFQRLQKLLCGYLKMRIRTGMWVEHIPFLSLFFHLKTAELCYPVMSPQQEQVLLLNGNNQAESWAMAEAFSRLQKSPCLCLSSPVTGVGWGAHIPLLSQSCCLLWVQEILTPSNCSWPQTIILAKARSCIFFSKD